MSGLKVSLFGSLQVSHTHMHTDPRLPHSAQALLAYLLLKRHRSHPRELLAGMFWGDYNQERARSCLNTALWRLRKTLEPDDIPGGTYLVRVGRDEIGFNRRADYWLDIEAFEQPAQLLHTRPERLSREDIQQLENVITLYRGDLLEGFYEDWALEDRERMHALYLSYLSHLMYCALAQQRNEDSLAYGQKILASDPLREDIHRELIRLYLVMGNRTAAARQYETCCAKLRATFGIQPMEETRRLFEQLEGKASSTQPDTPQPTSDLQSALSSLRHSSQTLENAQADVRRAMQIVEKYLQRAGDNARANWDKLQ